MGIQKRFTTSNLIYGCYEQTGLASHVPDRAGRRTCSGGLSALPEPAMGGFDGEQVYDAGWGTERSEAAVMCTFLMVGDRG